MKPEITIRAHPMLYTIGRTANYNEGLKNPPLLKMGAGKTEKNEDYPGGIVFFTIRDAEIFLSKPKWHGYSIYGLKATKEDTYWYEAGGYHALNKMAEIVDVKEGEMWYE